MSAIDGIDYIESSSTAGVSTITVRLRLNHDSNDALAEVSARLNQVRSELPEESESPVNEIERADRPYATFYLSFTSTSLDLTRLNEFLVREVQPAAMLTHGCTDFHGDHVLVHHASVPSQRLLDFDF